MRVHRFLTLALLAMGVTIAGQASAKAHHMAHESLATKTFVTGTARDGMLEVELGRLAVRRASDSDVREFAHRMIADHTKANEELTRLADRRGWKLPTDLGLSQKATRGRLEHVKSQDFDRDYMREMVSAHQHAIHSFAHYAEKGKDRGLRAWVDETLPTLREHERMARTTAERVGVEVAQAHTRMPRTRNAVRHY